MIDLKHFFLDKGHQILKSDVKKKGLWRILWKFHMEWTGLASDETKEFCSDEL
jgi:hypothetical protein